jgi:ribosomal protein L11 methyltransferase
MLFEICFKIQVPHLVKIELVKQLLLSLGVLKDEIVELNTKKESRLSVYFKSKVRAKKLKKDFVRLKAKGVSVIIKPLITQNWRDAWKKSFKPFALTRTFDIVPAEHRNKYRKSIRTPIYIDTSLAFGTGMHETTRFMAQLIEQQKDTFSSFFDIGTGTGVLAIIAKKCGASFIKAVDIDKEAVKIAQENFKRNSVKAQEIKVQDIGKMAAHEKYDFVAANLVTQDLISLKKKIVSFVRPQKYLAISGISLENVGKIKQEFKGLALRCIRIIKGKEWAAVLYQKVL